MIARQLDAAERSILILIYEFNSWPLAARLLDAMKRGVRVEIVIDARLTARERSLTRDLAAAGARIWLDGAHQIFHMKCCVIDEAQIIMGSMNWTDQGEQDHAEITAMFRDATQAMQIMNTAETHKRHAKRLVEENTKAAA